MFTKFYYKQKVVEEMIVVAGNVYEKFQASSRHIVELESAAHSPPNSRATIETEHAKIINARTVRADAASRSSSRCSAR